MSFRQSVIVLAGFANKMIVPLQKHNLHVHAWVYIIINKEERGAEKPLNACMCIYKQVSYHGKMKDELLSEPGLSYYVPTQAMVGMHRIFG